MRSRGRRSLAGRAVAVLAALAALGAGGAGGADATAAGRPQPRAVPAPTADTSVVTVKTGGIRTGDLAIGNLAGVQLGLYAAQTGGSPLFTCVSDADGDCNTTVPDTGHDGANRNKRYWVRQIAAPGGWYTNPSLTTSPGDTARSYAFETPALVGGQTYSSTGTGPNSFMIGTGSTNYTASQGVWQQSLNNPALPGSCGLRVALVMDLSGSMHGSVGALKTAASAFVDALQGTPSSMARFTFSTASPAVNGGPNAPGLVSVASTADAAAFKSAWTPWTENTAEGGTNWDRATYVPTVSGPQYDLAVMITDGLPTYYGPATNIQGPGSDTRFREVENGIYSANALKAKGTRVLAVGVGSGVTSANAALNLRAVSGPTKYDGSNISTADYFQESDFTGVQNALRSLVFAQCSPTVSIVKQIRAQDGTLSNAPAGWTFHGTAHTPGVTLPPTETTTADGTGTVNFPLHFPAGTQSADATFTEEQHPGYTLVQTGGKNAVCVNKLTSQPVPVTDTTDGFSLAVPVEAPVSCTVTNQAPPDHVPATLQVDKKWVVDGVVGGPDFDEGQQPSDLQSQLSTTPPGGGTPVDVGWGVSRNGYAAGDRVTVAEQNTITSGLDCDVTGVEFDGAPITPGSPSTQITLAAGANHHTLTNHVVCHTRLTLAKEVSGGDADPTSWTLHAIAVPPASPGPDGVTGTPAATREILGNGHYQLAEQLNSDDPALLPYKQIDRRTSLQSNPLSTGSMQCTAVDRNGVDTNWSDGLNGGATVPLGLNATCVATNEVVPLTLVKEVHGGSAAPADFTVTATPVDPGVKGLPSASAPGAPGPLGARVWLRPGQQYRISEHGGPAGYELTSVTCGVAGVVGHGNSALVTVPSGATGECTLVNTFDRAQLTLVKRVVNTHGGVAEATEWTLAATGPTRISGRVGDDSVTDALVQPGDYRLAEHGGPRDYDASAWTCRTAQGALAVHGGTVRLAADTDVTCEITNHDRKPAPTPTPTPTPTPPGPHPKPLPPTGMSILGSATAGAALLLALGAWLVRRNSRGRHHS